MAGKRAGAKRGIVFLVCLAPRGAVTPSAAVSRQRRDSTPRSLFAPDAAEHFPQQLWSSCQARCWRARGVQARMDQVLGGCKLASRQRPAHALLLSSRAMAGQRSSKRAKHAGQARQCGPRRCRRFGPQCLRALGMLELMSRAPSSAGRGCTLPQRHLILPLAVRAAQFKRTWQQTDANLCACIVEPAWRPLQLRLPLIRPCAGLLPPSQCLHFPAALTASKSGHHP